MITTTDRKTNAAQSSNSIAFEAAKARPGVDATADNVSGAPEPIRRRRRMTREPKAGKGATSATASALASSEDGAAARGSFAGPAATRPTKSGAVIALLQRKEGATLDQLVLATSWLPHTARAALTGLKKKGHVITSSKEEGQPRVYRAERA